jgi:nitrogen fixation NifU-like protein
VTAYRDIVIEHFRRPRNRAPLPEANRSAEGANPLCGDRIRVQLVVHDEVIADARFTADACALCIASASLLTEYVRGRDVTSVSAIDAHWIAASLEGEPPPGRRKCATLPLDTLRKALES